MICNTIGLTTDSFESIYVTGGAEVAEVYGGINYADPIFYKTQTMTGSDPLVFDSYPNAIKSYAISGNMTQTGTPTQSDPIYPQECGDLVTSGEHAGEYAIPITCGGETNNIYLPAPIRKIGDHADEVNSDGTIERMRTRKLVLTGDEVNWEEVGSGSIGTRYFRLGIGTINYAISNTIISTHFSQKIITSSTTEVGANILNSAGQGRCYVAVRPENVSGTTLSDFKSYLAQQYAAGTPVTVWYVLAKPVTKTVTAPTIPTIIGQNTLTVGTTLQPSSVSITGHIKPTTP